MVIGRIGTIGTKGKMKFKNIKKSCMASFILGKEKERGKILKLIDNKKKKMLDLLCRQENETFIELCKIFVDKLEEIKEEVEEKNA